MLPEAKRVLELVNNLPKEKLYSAIDFLEFLQERTSIPISDTGQEIIVGPDKSSAQVLQTFQKWRQMHPEIDIEAEKVRIDQILDESHHRLVRLTACYK